MENTFGSDGSVLMGAAASFGLIAAAFLVLVPGLEKTARTPLLKSIFVVLLVAPLCLVGAALVLVLFRNLAVSALCLILAIVIEPVAVTLVLTCPPKNGPRIMRVLRRKRRRTIVKQPHYITPATPPR